MAHIQQQVDIDACTNNLDHYAHAGDAQSCRDIGIALARDLQAARDELDRLSSEHRTAAQWLRDAQQAGLKALADVGPLRELADWLVALGETRPGPGEYEVTLDEIVIRARQALGRQED